MTSGFEDPANTFATSYQNEYTIVSGLGRLLYNYRNKYYLNATLRNDASSQIPTQNRNQQFWAIGAGWELTKEKFMESVKWIDF